MSKAKQIKTLSDLTPDARNANKHSQRGMGMMETSITECGYGDSMTVDKNGVVISGNGRLETLADRQMDNPIIVESDGTRPIIHQRVDLDLTKDERAKRLAILQNRVGETNLEWDVAELAALVDEGVELNDLFSDDEMGELLDEVPDVEFKEYGEDVEKEVVYCECPKCGEKFPR